MSEKILDPTIDKSTWGDGPWLREPDRLEWTHAGLPCLAVRHPRLGHWCGYAAVAPGHPLHRVGYHDESPALADALEQLKTRTMDMEKDYTFARGIAMLCGEAKPSPDLVLDVHGGITYSDRCRGVVCHVPKAGEPADVWWFGFDCGHSSDRSPGIDADLRKVGIASIDRDEEYRTLDYVRQQTNALADQLAALSEKTQTTRRPLADDDDRDESDSDAAEVLHEPEAELIGDDTVVDVDVIVPQGGEGDAA